MTQQELNKLYNQERARMNELVMRGIDQDKWVKFNNREAFKIINSEIDKLYARYSTAQGISVSELRKRADAMDIVEFQERARRAVEEKDFSPRTNEWLKIYNFKMRVSRLELMKATIAFELDRLYQKQENHIRESLFNEIKEELMLQQGILAGGSEILIDNIMKIVNLDFHGKGFSERIWGRGGLYDKHRTEVYKSLQTIFTTMEGYEKEKRRLMQLFQTTEYETMRLLRTELVRANSQARGQMYEEQGFTHYVYVCEPNACPVCRPMDNKVFKVEKREIGQNAPPMHPNCRCRDYGRIVTE